MKTFQPIQVVDNLKKDDFNRMQRNLKIVLDSLMRKIDELEAKVNENG